ncbi:MAG: hypothetical protein JKX68_06655 [Flavobacteriales bacterium]|nr:hypothetical protein [Flavobacteriales bacterium]
MKKVFTHLTIIALTAFALLTLFLSSSVIFDWFGIRAKEGNYVLFIVWANFISSVLYLFAAYGLIKLKKWTYQLLGVSALLLITALIGLFFHINAGGLYETKTVGAMFFRTSVTLIFTLLSYLRIVKWNN